MYSTYRWSSQLADRPSVVYFITLSFFLLTLKGTPKAFSRPHSAITWYYYYYYFLHFAWESTFCKKGLCRHKNECSKTLAYIYIYITFTGGVSQLVDRHSVVYFIALSFFHLTLKVSAKASSQPHSGTITWYYYCYYYYYYFLHFAWESTSIS